MVIKVDKNQPKTIKMDVNIQGIDKTKLNFLFKIKLGDITIGFTPTFVDDNKLEIHIPALNSKIVGIESGRYISCLEINDGEKYYLKPWEGELVVEEPQITATVYEYQELDTSIVDVNYVSESTTENNEKPKKKKIKTESKKPNKKITKKEAIEFVQKARKKLVNEDKEVVDKFIKDTLNKYGYNYNPEKEDELKTKQKPKNNSKNIKIESKDDIIKFLQSKGIKNERTLNTLMETIENRSGNDLETMFDVANRMVNPNNNDSSQFNNPNEILEYFRNQQTSYMNSQTPDMGESDENYSADSGSKSRLMEQIQKAKSDLNNQLNNNK